jgi:hypothetical protein
MKNFINNGFLSKKVDIIFNRKGLVVPIFIIKFRKEGIK